jgi:outer membrane protein assembly factor BamB
MWRIECRRDARLAGCAVACVLALGATTTGGDPAPASWTQWGGPGREFRAQAGSLATSWPETGPPRLWSRELGDGYSAILYDAGRLYTMYRDGAKETVVALEAGSGKTLWEHKYDSSPGEGHVHQFGDGPRATPLIAGDRIFTIGVVGLMHCLDKTSGKVLWSHDLWKEFEGNFLPHGYSSSPVEYGDTVIALVGGKGAAVVAFSKKDGSVVWKRHDFQNTYSSPKLLDVDGEQQLVTFMAHELIGLDPDNGDLEWSYPHENESEQNISMPVMADSQHLFLSSPEAGARGLRLTRQDGQTKVEEIWSTRKIQFYHVTSVRDGDYVYGSTGIFAPAFLAAVNIKTGEIAWRERGFAKANCLWADKRLIILDEDGTLALASATPEKLTVLARADLSEDVAWTVPTVVGTTIYLRDKKSIMALDLGAGRPA